MEQIMNKIKKILSRVDGIQSKDNFYLPRFPMKRVQHGSNIRCKQ